MAEFFSNWHDGMPILFELTRYLKNPALLAFIGGYLLCSLIFLFILYRSIKSIGAFIAKNPSQAFSENAARNRTKDGTYLMSYYKFRQRVMLARIWFGLTAVIVGVYVVFLIVSPFIRMYVLNKGGKSSPYISCPTAGANVEVNDQTITIKGDVTFRADSMNYDSKEKWGVIDCHDKNLIIAPEATLTIAGYDDGDLDYTDDFGVMIKARTINVVGNINANGTGYKVATGPGQGVFGSGAGAAYGGDGGAGARDDSGGRNSYGSAYHPRDLGSGGSFADGANVYGGAGGGAMALVAVEKLSVNGEISASGLNSDDTCSNGWGGGGGSGGSVLIQTKELEGNGKILASGGNAKVGCNNNGGGGGGGRVAVYFNNYDFNRNSLHFNSLARAGNAIDDNRFGESGTVGFFKSDIDWKNNNDDDLYVYSSWEFIHEDAPDDFYGLKSLHVFPGTQVRVEASENRSRKVISLTDDLNAQDATFLLNEDTFFVVNGNMSLVKKDGEMSVKGLGYQRRFQALVGGNFFLSQGAEINYVGTGYAPNQGLGAGVVGCNGTGGSFGGVGGNNVATTVYGSSIIPVSVNGDNGEDFGSGGGNSSCRNLVGSSGGGAVRLSVQGETLIDGDIHVDGASATHGFGDNYGAGTGAGGAIYLSVGKKFAGIGTLSATGGNTKTDSDGYSGSGGRIAVYLSDYQEENLSQYPKLLTNSGLAREGHAGEDGTLGLFVQKENQKNPDLYVLKNFELTNQSVLNGGWNFNNIIIDGGTMKIHTGDEIGTLTVDKNLLLKNNAQFILERKSNFNIGGNVDLISSKIIGAPGKEVALNMNVSGSVKVDSASVIKLDGAGTAGDKLSSGGGVLQFDVRRDLINNGQISADGNQSIDGRNGGGVGGSVDLSVSGVISGSGQVSSRGGDNLGDGEPGSGGRVTIKYGAKGDWNWTVLADADSIFEYRFLPPNAPKITEPKDSTVKVGLIPTIVGSGYSGEAAHVFSDWQVSEDNVFSDDCSGSSIVWCRLHDESNLTEVKVEGAGFVHELSGKNVLANSKTYYARVRYGSTPGNSAWSVPVSFTTIGIAVTPQILVPIKDAVGVTRNVTITSGEYVGNGGTHLASDWQICADSDCQNILAKVENSHENLTSLKVDLTQAYWILDVNSKLMGKTKLLPSDSYYVRVRYVDEYGASGWSSGVKFTTAQDNTVPAQPLNLEPIDEATNQSKTLTLKAGSFHDADGDNHGAAQWQIYYYNDCGGKAVWDSGATVDNLNEINVPIGILGANMSYVWRVRYSDETGTGWSPWSGCTDFATSNVTPELKKNIPDQTINEDAVVLNLFNLNDHFGDEDSDQHLIYTLESPAKHGRLDINTSGSVNFYPEINWVGSEEIKFVADDQNGQKISSNSVKIIVNNVNDAPTEPMSGFAVTPAEKGRVTSLGPTIGWGLGADIDSNDTVDKLSYLIRLGSQRGVISDYQYEYRSEVGAASIDLSKSAPVGLTKPVVLIDEKVYYYVVATVDSLGAISAWSAEQQFQINVALTPSVDVLQTVSLPDGESWWNTNSEVKFLPIGSTLIYRFDYKNIGDGTAEDVTIRTKLPEGLSYALGSLIVDGISQTDVARDDMAHVAQQEIIFTLDQVVSGGSGYVSYHGMIANANNAPSIKTYAYYSYRGLGKQLVINDVEVGIISGSISGAIEADIMGHRLSLSSVVVALYSDSNNNDRLDIAEDKLAGVVNTNELGNYGFDGLAARKYFVYVNSSQEKFGETYYPAEGNVGYQTVDLTVGENREQVAFSYNQYGTLGGKIMDTTDKFLVSLSGVKILLYRGDNAGNVLAAETTTDDDGTFIFTKLAVGSYFVKINENDEVLRKYYRVKNGFYQQITLASGQNVVNLSTEYNRYAEIGGRILLDGGDGISGAVGIVVRLYFEDLKLEKLLTTVITDATGQYSLTQIKAGKYWIQVDESNSSLVKYYNEDNSNPRVEIIASGQNKTGLDFLYNRYSKISGVLRTEDGSRRFPQEEIRLYSAGDLVSTVYSNDDGEYEFTDVPASEYTVVINENKSIGGIGSVYAPLANQAENNFKITAGEVANGIDFVLKPLETPEPKVTDQIIDEPVIMEKPVENNNINVGDNSGNEVVPEEKLPTVEIQSQPFWDDLSNFASMVGTGALERTGGVIGTIKQVGYDLKCKAVDKVTSLVKGTTCFGAEVATRIGDFVGKLGGSPKPCITEDQMIMVINNLNIGDKSLDNQETGITYFSIPLGASLAQQEDLNDNLFLTPTELSGEPLLDKLNNSLKNNIAIAMQVVGIDDELAAYGGVEVKNISGNNLALRGQITLVGGGLPAYSSVRLSFASGEFIREILSDENGQWRVDLNLTEFKSADHKIIVQAVFGPLVSAPLEIMNFSFTNEVRLCAIGWVLISSFVAIFILIFILLWFLYRKKQETEFFAAKFKKK